MTNNPPGSQTADAMVERVARALVKPLGYSQQAADNWGGIWVGNQMDSPETGSLEYLCKSLARAAITALDTKEQG